MPSKFILKLGLEYQSAISLRADFNLREFYIAYAPWFVREAVQREENTFKAKPTKVNAVN